MNNKHRIPIGFFVVTFVSSGMLFWALSRSNPYGYYILLRWIVCGTAAYGTFKAVELESGWVWTLGIIALLFNPILPVYLSREIWAPIDVTTGIIFIAFLFSIRKKKPIAIKKDIVGKESTTNKKYNHEEGLAKLKELAGKDAVTFACITKNGWSKDNGTWTCVCGTENPLSKTSCSNCGRNRDRVLKNFTRKQVLK